MVCVCVWRRRGKAVENLPPNSKHDWGKLESSLEWRNFPLDNLCYGQISLYMI